LLVLWNESIKQYLRRIVSKGGKALAENRQAKAKAAAKAAKAIAGTPKAKARAAKAAKARWAKRKQELLKSGPGKLLTVGSDAKTTSFSILSGLLLGGLPFLVGDQDAILRKSPPKI